MCGILFTNNISPENKIFDTALEMMRHRGPDAKSGTFSYKNFRLGHNRLKILDLDNRSNQPFWSHDKRYVIIFNGEIYNYKELAKQFKIAQRTTSDTEVLIELYTMLGPAMLNHLNGMFAMVILDTMTDKFFVARDRLGIKPLYYSLRKDGYIFASEIAPFTELIDTLKPDPVGIRQYRKMRAFFNNHTLYSDIKMFPAGHYMENGHLNKYWQLPEKQQTPPDKDELQELISNSVNLRCISDVPIGSYLSGGLDSTIIAGLANKPDTWTIGFNNANEFEWARLAADKFKSSHSEVLIDEAEFFTLAKEMIAKRKEPLSVPNEVLIYKMTRRVKERNTVVLSGEGADELFFGYDRIFRWANSNKWDIREFDALYSYGTNDDIEILEYILEPYSHLKRSIDKVAAFFQISHLHGLLRRLDNSTMTCSVEARVPFVDHRLVERLSGVDFDFRMRNGIVKQPLKDAFQYLVPEKIINRVKIGFPVPLDDLMFNGITAETSMDKWLLFNLQELGMSTDEFI